MDGVQIHIGRQTRELRFGIKGVQMAERFLDGPDLQTATMSNRLTFSACCQIAAAGFSTYGDGGVKITPPQVERWVENEPKKLVELERAVIRAVSLHLVEVGKMSEEDQRAMGEALANAARASVRTPDSSSADDSGSPPTAT